MFSTHALAAVVTVAMADGKDKVTGKLELEKNWQAFWDGLTGDMKIFKVLQFVGMLMVVAALIGWLWQRRRNNSGGNTGSIWGALIIGCLFSLPNTIVPLLLAAIDLLVNGAVSSYNKL